MNTQALFQLSLGISEEELFAIADEVDMQLASEQINMAEMYDN